MSKYLYICNKVSSLDNLVVFQKEAISDLWSDLGAFLKKSMTKLGILRLERKGEKKHEWLRGHRKAGPKRELIFNVKIFKYE